MRQAATICLLLAFLPVPGAASNPLGDQVHVVEDAGGHIHSTQLAMHSNGAMFLALGKGSGLSGPWSIELHRSLDGGTTWSLWSTLLPETGDESYVLSVELTEGNLDRLHVLYTTRQGTGDARMELATADPNQATPSWTTTTVLSDPSLHFVWGDMVTDYQDFPNGYYIYVVAQGGNLASPGDIWFARSTDRGASFEIPYLICDVDGTTAWYRNPTLDYGNGVIHAAWDYGDDWAGATGVENGLRHRRATNYGNGGLADWGPVNNVYPINGVDENAALDIAANPNNGEVLLLASTDLGPSTGKIWRSPDGGVSWPPEEAIYLDDPDLRVSRAEWNAAGDRVYLAGGRFLAGDCDQVPITLEGVGSVDPVFSTERCFGRPDGKHDMGVAEILMHPTRAGEHAVSWDAGGFVCDPEPGVEWYVRFNASWFDDPGYPVLEAGMPRAIDHRPMTPPLVANLDADPELEFAYSDAEGRVHVRDHLGASEAGWPRDVGDVPLNGHVAAGDLNGDGRPAIVVGDTAGKVWAMDANGSDLPGFPVDLGTGQEVFSSIGPIRAPYPQHIVAASGQGVYLVDWAGRVAESWALSHLATLPPSIGDITGDGRRDIVLPAEGHLFAMNGEGGHLWDRSVGAGVVVGTVGMADLDLDGDVELLVPHSSGFLFAFDERGELHFLHAPGGAVGQPGPVAIGEFRGGDELDIAYTTWAELHVVDHLGNTAPGFPQPASSGALLLPPVLGGLHAASADILAGDLGGGEEWAWSASGTPVPGWPRPLVPGPAVTPALGDLDRDGDNEVVFLGDSTIAIVDVNHPPLPQAHRRWNMAARDPGRTSCQGCDGPIVTSTGEDRPTRAAFAPPHPNPAPGPATFSFVLDRATGVELELFDLRGRQVRQLLRERREAGQHTLHFDGRDGAGQLLANGQYLARLSLGGQLFTRRLVVLR